MSIINVDKKIFKEKIESESTILIEFWAPWCVYCRRIAPVLSKIAAQYEGELEIGKINIDEEPELAGNERIQTVPSLVFYSHGKKAAAIEAPDSKTAIDDFIKVNLSK